MRRWRGRCGRDATWAEPDRGRPGCGGGPRRAPVLPTAGAISEDLRERLWRTMWDDVGVLRTREGIERGLEQLELYAEELLATGLADGDRAFNLTWHDWLNLESLIEVSRGHRARRPGPRGFARRPPFARISPTPAISTPPATFGSRAATKACTSTPPRSSSPSCDRASRSSTARRGRRRRRRVSAESIAPRRLRCRRRMPSRYKRAPAREMGSRPHMSIVGATAPCPVSYARSRRCLASVHVSCPAARGSLCAASGMAPQSAAEGKPE